MSSAILYLAIIAIWAVFLVPAWIRRPHAHPANLPEQAETDTFEHADGDLHVEYVTDTENDGEVSVEADFHVEVSRHEHEHREYRHEVPSYAGYALDAELDAPRRACGAAVAAAVAEPRADAARPAADADDPGRDDRRDGGVLRPGPGPVVDLRAARRDAGAVCSAAPRDRDGRGRAGPQAGRLGGRRGPRRAWEAHAQAEAEREAYEASLAAADAGAQIIDISGRVSDQLYDQYADAAVRAVGD